MIKIYTWGQVPPTEIFSRVTPKTDVEGTVSEIIAEVVKNKDNALKAYAEKFDKVRLESLEVTQAEMDDAYENADAKFVEILEEAAKKYP